MSKIHFSAVVRDGVAKKHCLHITKCWFRIWILVKIMLFCFCLCNNCIRIFSASESPYFLKEASWKAYKSNHFLSNFYQWHSFTNIHLLFMWSPVDKRPKLFHHRWRMLLWILYCTSYRLLCPISFIFHFLVSLYLYVAPWKDSAVWIECYKGL